MGRRWRVLIMRGDAAPNTMMSGDAARGASLSLPPVSCRSAEALKPENTCVENIRSSVLMETLHGPRLVVSAKELCLSQYRRAHEISATK